MDYTRLGEAVPLLQEQEVFPRHWPGAATPRQPTLPDLPGSLQELLEAEEVAGDPVVTVVTLQFLPQRLVLNRDRLMPIDSTRPGSKLGNKNRSE